MFQYRDSGGATRVAGAMYFMAADLSTKTIDEISFMNAALETKRIYKAGIRLAASPTFAVGSTTAKTGPVYSNTVSVGVAGGTPPYNHSWTATGGITVNNPASSFTDFRATPPGLDSEVQGTATDHVTDANGIANSIAVSVTISRNS